jgi:hypothetical protein
MHVQMIRDPSADKFLNQLLDMGSGKVAVDESTGCTALWTDFCTIVDSQNALIEFISPYIHTIHKSRLAGRKSNFSNKKGGRLRFEFQDTKVVVKRIGFIQIN